MMGFFGFFILTPYTYDMGNFETRSSETYEKSTEIQEMFLGLKNEENLLKKEMLRTSPEPRSVEQRGLNKVKIPYDIKLGDKRKSRDFIVTRMEDNKLFIEVHDPNTGERLDDGVGGNSVPINGEEHFEKVLGANLSMYVSKGEDTKKTVGISGKMKEAYKILFNTSVDEAFDDASLIRYEVNKYTYGRMLSFYRSVLKSKIVFKNIPESEHFRTVLNAVISYNKSLYPQRNAESTDEFFRPDRLDYYQGYINEVEKRYDMNILPEIKIEKGEQRMKKEDVKKSSKKENKDKVNIPEILTLGNSRDSLLEYGRDGLLSIGKLPKRKKRDYDFMKLKRFNKRVPGTSLTYYKYIDQELSKSKLSLTMRRLVKCIPMQESSYQNKYFSHHKKNQAQYFRQFIESTAEDYGMKVNSWKDERRDIKKSTAGAIKYFTKLYSDLEKNTNLQALFTEYGVDNWQTKDLIISFFALNGYNAGGGHMTRALKIMVEHEGEQKHLRKFINRHGAIGIILYVTNEYPKRASEHQKGISPKYLIESPAYVYNLFKFDELDQKS